ncbi:hypothetical protein [Peribacillus asahii]|uniref:hypothetical protein n=1 Tax=Peribacillus asahii TaxID=228899 RepID=UPI002079AD61|nr:hypothetical protein [Peribacillus asahii]USK62189.1 hypothetical protein LIT37_23720 [Peribacillus asahii]
MLKKMLISLLLITLLTPITAFAEDDKENKEMYSCGKPVISKEIEEGIKKYKEDDANMAEKFTASQIENLFHIGDINSISNLVFGNPYCVWIDKDQKMASDGIFTTTEREDIIDPILKLFSGSYTVMLTLAILIAALKMGLKASNPIARQEFWSSMGMWIVSAIFIAAYTPLTNLVFELNLAVVQGIKDMLTAAKVKIDGFSIISSLEIEKDEDISLAPINSLGHLITFLGEWVLAAILNIIYIARKVTIMLLLMLGYVAAYALIFPKTKAFFGVWVKELVGNVFLQSIHALVLFAFAMMAQTGANSFFKLCLMMMFIPLSGMISKWLNIGDSSTKLGQAATMMGMGGLVATTMIAQQAGNVIRGGNLFGGSNSSNTNSNMSAGGDITTNGSIMNAGGAMDSATTAITANATGENSNIWNSLKKGAGVAGAVVGGTAGMVLGPAGAGIGAAVGMKTSQGIMQAGRNLSSGAIDTLKTLHNARNYSGVGGTGFSGMMKDLQARRNFFGNLGESAGAMIGLSTAGRALGHAASGVSRQRIAGSLPEVGGTGVARTDGTVSQMSWAELSQANPGATVRFAQTNKESGFFMQNANGAWSRVGTTGQADPTLKDGAVRMMDYQLNTRENPLQLQGNGTYKYTPNSDNVSGSFNPLSHVSAPTGTVGTQGSPSQVVSATGNGSGAMSTPVGNVSAPTGTVGTQGSPSQVVSATGNESSTMSMPVANVSAPTGTAGLQGSTSQVLRTSDAYVVGGGNKDGRLDTNVVASASPGQRIADPSFNGANINPDSFVSQVVRSVDTRSGSDRGADLVAGTANTIKKSGAYINSAAGWVGNKNGRSKKRNREII